MDKSQLYLCTLGEFMFSAEQPNMVSRQHHQHHLGTYYKGRFLQTKSDQLDQKLQGCNLAICVLASFLGEFNAC